MCELFTKSPEAIHIIALNCPQSVTLLKDPQLTQRCYVCTQPVRGRAEETDQILWNLKLMFLVGARETAKWLNACCYCRVEWYFI